MGSGLDEASLDETLGGGVHTLLGGEKEINSDMAAPHARVLSRANSKANEVKEKEAAAGNGYLTWHQMVPDSVGWTPSPRQVRSRGEVEDEALSFKLDLEGEAQDRCDGLGWGEVRVRWGEVR